MESICQRCGKAFLRKIKTRDYKYCSSKCSNSRKEGRWAQKYDACVDCGTIERSHECRGLCKPCWLKRFFKTDKGKASLKRYRQSEKGKAGKKRQQQRWRERYPERYQAQLARNKARKDIELADIRRKRAEAVALRRRLYDQAKKSKRRAMIKATSNLTSKFLEALWNSTDICELCNRLMERHGRYPWGRHLDHIIPLHAGGTHTEDNVRYIHAICNNKRPENYPKNFATLSKDGTLFSTGEGSISPGNI